jgi:Homeobox KN domain
MDTLHVVVEDQVQDMGGPTGLKALRSWDRTALDHPDFEEDASSCRRSGARFPKEAVILLRKWMDAHKQNPYPTEEEKEDLQNRTGLNATQVSNWLANTRRRNKAKRTRGVSPSMHVSGSSSSRPIPTGRMVAAETWEAMHPMDRWKISPPENEPALVSDIANAVANSKLRTLEPSAPRSGSRTNVDSSESGSIMSMRRPPSVTSLETGISESQQSSGSFSTRSIGSSRSLGSKNSLVSSGSGNRKDKRRRRKVVARLNSNLNSQKDNRPFQCTFCTDTFRTKYDWIRHEKSLHLTLEKWICAPLGGVIASPDGTMCVFCGEVNPTENHLESHNHTACHDKGLEGRTFYRKDHLRQHLRLVHGCKMIDTMESWKSETMHIRSRCGFCEAKFETWAERCDHLSRHFRDGAKMKDWRGCRGLDPEVGRHVTHAMPAFLIGNEATTPNPFSATIESSMGHSPLDPFMQSSEDSSTPEEQLALWNAVGGCPVTMIPFPAGSTDANAMGTWSMPGMESFNMQHPPPKISTCWEVLTIRLGLYVRELQAAGIPVTDQRLQQHARMIIYDSDDDWNQTAADDPQWLELFKKAYHLPNKATDTHVDFMEDLGLGVQDLSFDAMLQDQSWDTSMYTTAYDTSGLVATTAGEMDIFGQVMAL